MPFGFVLGILVTTVLAMFGHPFLAVLMWGLYWLLAIGMAVQAAVCAPALPAVNESPRHSGGRNIGYVLLPFLFFLLHVSYGAGTFVGLVKMPFWRRSHHGKESGGSGNEPGGR